jgi:hypothetical protein
MSDEALRQAARELLDAWDGISETIDSSAQVDPHAAHLRLNTAEAALRTALAAPTPAAEVTQEQVREWVREARKRATVVKGSKTLWTTAEFNLDTFQHHFATLAHAAGYEAGRQAGGRDRYELAAALRELLGYSEFAEEKIEGEWGCGRSLETLEALGELPPEIMHARAILDRIDAATTEERGRG